MLRNEVRNVLHDWACMLSFISVSTQVSIPLTSLTLRLVNVCPRIIKRSG